MREFSPLTGDVWQKLFSTRQLAPMDSYKDWTGLGFQMLAVIGVFTAGGLWLDKKLGLHFPVFTVTLSVTGVVLSLYSVIRRLPKD